VLRLGDGAHLHRKTTKQKEKKRKQGGAETLLLPRLDDGTHLCPKKPKKGKKGELKLPFY
jgi:hypothetical protein